MIFRTLRASRRAGFTLIELMVAMTIGLILTIVVAQLFIGSRRTYATTDELSRMQENMRFTYQLLTRTVHLAGYKTSPNSEHSAIFTAAAPALEATNSTGTVSDFFTVRYQGNSNGPGAADGSVVDCLGAPIIGGVLPPVASTFTIAEGKNKANALFCNGVEVVSDVENMQLLLGEDLNGDAIVDRFVRPDVVGAANMDNVRSIRFALLFRTANAGAAALPDTTQHVLHEVTLPAFNDTRLRRVFVMTVSLRNRTP
jgi:type IV pilus assembly protein PilW